MPAFDNTAPVAKTVPASFDAANDAPVPNIIGSLTGLSVQSASLALVGANFVSPSSPEGWTALIDGVTADTVSAVLLCNQTNPAENGVWDPSGPTHLPDLSLTDNLVRVTGSGDTYKDALFQKQADGSYRNVGAPTTVFNNTAPTPIAI